MAKITDFFVKTIPKSGPSILEVIDTDDQENQSFMNNIDAMDVSVNNGNNSTDNIADLDNTDKSSDKNNNQSNSKLRRSFVRNWLSHFTWLVKISDNEVKCSICEMNRSDRKNDWASGKLLSEWHKTTFKRHARSKKHRENLLIAPQQKNLIKATKNANLKAEAQTQGLMLNVLAAIQMEMSINKVIFLHSLSDLHIERTLQNCDGVTDSSTKLSSKHCSLYSTYKIINALNSAVTRDEIHKFKNCQAFCLHVDESTDFNTNKYLLLYLTIVSCYNSQSSEEHYGVTLPLEDSCDAETIARKIASWLENIGIKKRQLLMFTSDGASVMLGRRQGVAERLRSNYGYTHLLDFHCVCHRENLALKDAFEMSDEFWKLEVLLRETISFLSNYKNLAQLKTVAEVLQQDLYMPRRIFEIRWLSRFQVISNFVKSIEIILAFFEEKRENDIIGETLYNHLSSCKNLILLHHLHDLLNPLELLMVQLQKKNLHPFDAMVFTKSAIDQIEAKCMCASIAGPTFISLMNKIEQKKIQVSDQLSASTRFEMEAEIRKLASNIITNLKDRLWNNYKILKYFQIFKDCHVSSLDKESLLSYGHKELEKLTKFYKTAFDLDESQIKHEWDAYKFTYVKASTSAGENWKDTLKKCVNDPEVFPNLSQLAAAVLCFNAQNATVERGFSLLSRIKTKLRNRLSVPVIDMLLRLRLSTVNYQDFDFHQAFQYYVKKRTYSLGIKQKHKQNLEDADKDAGYNCFTDLVENDF